MGRDKKLERAILEFVRDHCDSPRAESYLKSLPGYDVFHVRRYAIEMAKEGLITGDPTAAGFMTHCITRAGEDRLAVLARGYWGEIVEHFRAHRAEWFWRSLFFALGLGASFAASWVRDLVFQ